MSKDVSGRIKSSIIFLTIITITLSVTQLFICNKVFLCCCGIISILEIYSAYQSPSRIYAIDDRTVYQISAIETFVVLGGVLAYLMFTREQAILVQAGVIACDTFAYITGKLCGRKIIRRRPFPRVSPNKSYEGIIGGITVATVVMFGISLWQGHYGTATTFFHYAAVILVGWCTVCGDLLASLTKRILCIKDSNACIHDHWLLKHPEKLMDGYGGYLDRLDSLFFAALVMGLIKCFDT